MMFQPVDALEYGIPTGQSSLQRNNMPRQGAALFVNTHFQGAMPGGQFEQFRVHSDLLR